MKTTILAFCAVAQLGVLLVAGADRTPPRLAFSTDSTKPLASEFRWSNATEPYLVQLRTSENLDAVVAGTGSDFQKVQKLTAWAHHLWKHNGDNEPAKNDPLTILQEARQGRNFRCVEYSIVLAAALNAVGVPARVLGLRTSDVETRPSGAGHVVVEAYLREQKRWIMADGQYDVIPVLHEEPINAIELQAALAEGGSGVGVSSSSKTDQNMWLQWVARYLYYFNARIDNRIGCPDLGPDALMLVPIGAKEPKVFQRNRPIKNTTYTHSATRFYPTPPLTVSRPKPSE